MDTITPSAARSDLFNLLSKTIKGHKPLRITSKEGSAILLSEEDYDSIMETAELLSVPGLKASIKKADKEIAKGEVYTFDEAFRE